MTHVFEHSNGVVTTVWRNHSLEEVKSGEGAQLVETDEDVQVGMVFADGEIGPVPLPNLERLRSLGQRKALLALTEFGRNIIGNYPPHELPSWSNKAVAAKAYDAGTADADQVADIETEAALRGVTPTAMATLIITKAREFGQMAAALSGLRGTVQEAIGTASSQAEIDAALTELETGLARLM